MRGFWPFLATINLAVLCTKGEQAAFSMSENKIKSWRVELSNTWDVLGPFPIHAREQHFLSPSFPLNLSEPIDYSEMWPSSYADNGSVLWTTLDSKDGKLEISFPHIRWKSLRATEGWAALQHHAILHSTLTVFPPSSAPLASPIPPPSILVQLKQASYFTVLPKKTKPQPKWYAGNIYAMERAPPRIVSLPSEPSLTEATEYDLFVSGDYEIRLFGDPLYQRNSDIPVQSISITVDVEEPAIQVKHEPTQDAVCDFVDGIAFGEALGVAMRSVSGWWEAVDVVSTGKSKDLKLEIVHGVRIAPSQTRVIPIRIVQGSGDLFPHESLDVDIALVRDGEDASASRTIVSVSLPIKHHQQWTSSSPTSIKASYFFGSSMPTVFIAIPPRLGLEDYVAAPPLLCLHGAGVDIDLASFWPEAIPRNDASWTVLPTGRTSWGLDWHGPSAQDVWQSLDTLISILERDPLSVWRSWSFSRETPVVLMGHSNGGQGAWYLASRFPDRVLGVVPAAAYIKSQAYIPLTMSRSAHFIDPALRAILETSLTPDNNDLFMSNIADIPVLAVHGGDDENVPVWHSREYASLLKAWRKDANVTLREDPGEGHWYDTVLNNDQVREFMAALMVAPRVGLPSSDFTLTVAAPSESGSLHGWKIESLITPGRLGRLRVSRMANGESYVATSNVHTFSLDPRLFDSLVVDGLSINIPQALMNIVRFEINVETRKWQVTSSKSSVQPPSRMQAILTTAGSIVLVVSHLAHFNEMSLALRISHDLNMYHKLDSEIVSSSEALRRLNMQDLGEGNIVVIGDTTLPFLRKILDEPQTPFRLHGQKLLLDGRIIDGPGLGILFLHPHPTNPHGHVLCVLSTDEAGLERAGKLFPIRTGVAVPDWIVTGPIADSVGAAGVIGAGVWAKDWTWNEAMSWLYEPRRRF